MDVQDQIDHSYSDQVGHAASTAADPSSDVKRELVFGLVPGLADITCCVSPVVFALLGIATAAKGVTLGDTLYYPTAGAFAVSGSSSLLRRSCGNVTAAAYVARATSGAY